METSVVSSPASRRSILHLIETSGPGGAESMLVNHICNLRQHGVDSEVVLIKDGWLRGRLEGLGIKCHVFPLHRFLSPAWLGAVSRLIRDRGYSDLHSHEFAMNCHAAALSLLSKRPAVATVHGKNYYADKATRRLLYRLSSKVSRFVAVSTDIRSFLSTRVGLRSSDIEVIPNGVDIKAQASRPDIRIQVRDELRVGDSEILVGAVGNLYPVKGHTYLIEAAKRVCELWPRARFVIAGRGGERDKLQQQIDSLGLTDRFHLLGFREDVSRLLQAFDIFAMPSLSEGLPISILEAMAARRVVIASSVGGIPELIDDGRTGLLVEPASSNELADRLIKLIQSDETRTSIAQAAFQLVTEQYSQDVCTRRYLELYS